MVLSLFLIQHGYGFTRTYFKNLSTFIVFQKESEEDQLQVINTLLKFLIILQYIRPVNLIVVLGNVVRTTNISMADC